MSYESHVYFCPNLARSYCTADITDEESMDRVSSAQLQLFIDSQEFLMWLLPQLLSSCVLPKVISNSPSSALGNISEVHVG